jgi:hypothetical protein
VQQGLMDMGMDSLMAVDFKSQLEQDLGMVLPATVAYEFPTIADIVEYLFDELFKSPSEPDSEIQNVESEPARDDLDTLSDDELAELLRHEIDQAKQGGRE